MSHFVDSPLFLQVAVLSLLGGACGALLTLLLLALCRCVSTAPRLSTQKLQAGSARAALLIALSIVALSALACASPPAHYSDAHGVWLEHVKRGGW